jgi:hypothetical protein
LITQIDGLTFDEANKDRVIIELDGLMIPFISKQKLIMNKMATGREKDRLDVKTLKGG